MLKKYKEMQNQYDFDFSDCLNKDIICQFHFPLGHDIKYWVK